MKSHPLAEVFGYPTSNFSDDAKRHRREKLCPFNNKVPQCTKDKANDPLGVCSVFAGDGDTAITCPVRFREGWDFVYRAQEFFFPDAQNWTTLGERNLRDGDGNSAGNIDFVSVAYNDDGEIYDFGVIEVQAVYISGNVRKPFEYYLKAPQQRHDMIWTETHVGVDLKSSGPKRLGPQIIQKGKIMEAWGKKMAIVLEEKILTCLPAIEMVSRREAEIAWIIYGLDYDAHTEVYRLKHSGTVYSTYKDTFNALLTSEAGDVQDFYQKLQAKLKADHRKGRCVPPVDPSIFS